MTREEAKTNLNMISVAFVDPVTKEQRKLIDDTFDMAIQALSQEPCDDTVSIRKDVLKCRVGKIVAYNVEWLKKHWQMEMDIVCGVKPCDDAISRQAVLDKTIRKNSIWNSITSSEGKNLEEIIFELPSVTQKSETVTEFADRCRECGAKYGKLLEQKSGHWIYTGDYLTEGMLKCSECGEEIDVSESYYDFCPVCGAKMESEE